MANPKSKGRMIRADVSESKKIASLSPKACALFFMLVPHFNSHGKQNGEPAYIKGHVCKRIDWLPLKQIGRYLKEISNKTNVKWFKHDGLYYLHSINFQEHQKFEKGKMGEDRLPDYPGLVDIKSATSRDLIETQDISISIREKGEGGSEKGESAERSTPLPPGGKVRQLVDAWNRMAEASGLVSVIEITEDRKSLVEKRLREKPPDWWLEAIQAAPFKIRNNWEPTFGWFFGSVGAAVECLEERMKKPGSRAGNTHTQKKSGLEEFANEKPTIDITP